MAPLELVLADFQGPLDLLLHLIRQSKIKIYDIPIAQVTQQYLDYLQQMQSLQLDIAGDYLVMATTLMRIKSQMLLPQAPVLDELAAEDEGGDPRSDLVAQLLTYQTFQNITQTLQDYEKKRQLLHAKAVTTVANPDRIPLRPGVKVARDLALSFRQLQARQQPVDLVFPGTIETMSLEAATGIILEKLAQHPVTTFGQLLQKSASSEEVVTKFMALLELTHNSVIQIQQSDYQADIEVKLWQSKQP
ncbi:segregation/condensation protein A [Lactobacillus sp. DCY120]|uniref:Segregation and condensation protein A n=1 Tax=Bombilactobacillus apium TaxID=2675299 RepID=A0A850R153_9LACO|nr:segregation/condensation protein A [Bombilactobacillus apium]NVY95751.1 segregation/condensation protein A [Bombilactobacillus apium]